MITLKKTAFKLPIAEVNPSALVKDAVPVLNPPRQLPVSQKGLFTVVSNRLTSVNETYLKTKGAFKIRVQNEGNIGIKIFGNFYLASYADETFETGDANLSFATDTSVEFDESQPSDQVNILLTTYSLV